ncbi:hypothetical protein PIB30_074525 [Stylosanthes scabra]|uniref:Uncharacterized protein n=1 Tax=Stylosanthes scabra TaxID=79078 RepID=A0ABU6TRR3_9FABA|nr:hypothetical protein [Stylosanthes scabra]
MWRLVSWILRVLWLASWILRVLRLVSLKDTEDFESYVEIELVIAAEGDSNEWVGYRAILEYSTAYCKGVLWCLQRSFGLVLSRYPLTVVDTHRCDQRQLIQKGLLHTHTCWLASATVSINSHASSGVLLIKAPPLDALIITLSVGIKISLRIALVLDGGNYFSKNHFLNSAQSIVTSFGKVWYQSFAFPSKENGRAKALTASSSPPVLLVVAQITSKSLRCLIGSSPDIPWNLGGRLIRPDLSSKLAFSSGYLVGWLSIAVLAPPSYFSVSLGTSPIVDVPELEERSRSKSGSEEYAESFSDASCSQTQSDA